MRTFRSWSLLLAAILVTEQCSSINAPKSIEMGTALVGGVLIDGTGGPPVEDAVIVYHDQRICAVGHRSDFILDDDIEVIDVDGSTILPGFFNTHVHGGFIRANLEAWARQGVLTVRDLGAVSEDDLFDRRDQMNEENSTARLVAAGPMLTVPHGYPIDPFNSPAVAVIRSEEEARVVVNQLIDDGADIIKVAVESGESFGMNLPTFTAEELRIIVETAHERGKRVSAHILTSGDVERALDAGVDDLAHMAADFVSDSIILRVVDQGVYWVPTLELWQGAGPVEAAQENLGRFVDAGGLVALGTDYDGYYTPFQLGMPIIEMELMQAAGMTPMQIICSATRNAAAVCGLETELGTLETGKMADIIVVRGDPLDDMGVLLDVGLVIHAGRIIEQ